MKRKRTVEQRVVSYGVLLYKTEAANVRYLLGLIPQRNWWTVFKGLPKNDASEAPTETALREFAEETGTQNVLTQLQAEHTLKGRAGKKDLVIFLQNGSNVPEDCFNVNRVVKIDQGFMKGKPEIVKIKWLTFEEAMGGFDGARLYTSQQGILRQAQEYLLLKRGIGKTHEKPIVNIGDNQV